MRTSFSLPISAVLVAGLAWLAIASPFMGGLADWTSESGAVEWLGFIALMLCPVAFFLRYPVTAWARRWHVPILTLLMAKREAEADWWYLDERLFKADFYAEQGFSSAAVLGGLAVLMVVLALLTLLIFGLRAFLKGLVARQTWAIVVFTGFAAAVVAQAFEEFAAPAATSDALWWIFALVEETLEALFSVFLLAAICHAALPASKEPQHG